MSIQEAASDEFHPGRARFSFSLRAMFIGVLVIGALLGIIVAFAKLVTDSRRAAIASASQGPLNQLSLALHNYHDNYGQFPPAYTVDSSGQPMHSWRVLILPYVEESALYKQYDFSEPWNGPNNSQLADRMPSVFCSASERESSRRTNIVAVVGTGTAFPGASTTRLQDFADGPENTILLTEIANSRIQWTEPVDLKLDEMSFVPNDSAKPSISSARWRQPMVVFADSIRAYSVGRDMPAESLRALFTIAGGERITRDDLVAQGQLK